jgi:hypothetical protein
MELNYNKSDLKLKHYTWTVDNRDNPAAHDLGTEIMDTGQGYEVLLFANTFLELYRPRHTIIDLRIVEIAIARHLPYTGMSKSEVAVWFGKYFILTSGRPDSIKIPLKRR